MKNKLLPLLVVIITGSAFQASAQCPSITCPSDITVNTDGNSCDALVNFTDPIGIDNCASGSQTFNYTGAQQSFVVPIGVTTITVDAFGAQGGANWVNNTNYGGHVQADIAVTPGSTIYIYVGEQPTTTTGGWNGGGNGETAGLGGGGASDIRIGGTTLNDRIVVAGGAGGGGYWSSQEVVGGYGGGLIGGPGYRDTPATEGGDPGTQVGSGDGTCASFNNPICAGGFGYGGAPSGCGCEGYGGGGGWYGGAGSGNCRGGGGGSSYAIPSATNVTHNPNVRPGDGEITLSWSGVGGGNVTTTQTAGLTSGSSFPLGANVVTFEATDGIDTVQCSFTVTVIDTISPSIIAPADVTSCNSIVNGIAPTTWDNCTGSNYSYSMSGATTGGGNYDASGTAFNVGVTTVVYSIIDSSGNQSSDSFTVTVNPTPSVSLATFSEDSICVYADPIALPAGTPASGNYSGNGVAGAQFDPTLAGNGVHWVSYSYTDTTGCTGVDSVQIVVDGCLSVDEMHLISKIRMYPNPTEGMLTIANETDAILSYEIIAVDGKRIENAQGLSGEFTIDLNAQENGIYLITLSDGNAKRTMRIVKQ